MKYKKYPSYKDSGVEWLGDIPENWNLLKNRHIFKTKDKVLNDKEDMTVLSLTTNGVKVKNNLSFGKSTESYVGHQMVYPGNLVFTPRDFDQTPILSGVSKYKGCISNLYLVLETNSKAYNHFVDYYWWGLKYKVNYFKNFSYGIRFSYNFEQFKEIPFLQPPIQEQQQIANFLDKATAKIDTLIEKQTKQIELLKEKRQAVISHAVTKGINPNVPMKDSGVEWLGEIPEHWEVSKLKYKILKLESGTSVNAADIPANENEYGVLKTSCVYTEKFRHNENKTVVQEEIYRLSCPLQKNTLIVSRMNTPELVGATGYVQNTHINIFLPDRLWQVYFTCNTRLIHYITLTKLYRNYIKTVCDGTSSSMQNLTQEDFKDFICALPFSFDEQNEIVNYLDEKTSKIDTLIEKSNKSIELLKEKRTALISAAVTGKIDVREEK